MGNGEGALPHARARPPLRRRPVVLLYHGFTEVPRADDPENLFVEVGAFEAQLDLLLARGWTPLDLDGYLAACRGRSTPRRSFLVTIDDALESVAHLAAPVMARRGVPSVLYVPAGLMGRTATWLPAPADEPILSEDALGELVRDHDIELGGHGWEHIAMAGLTADVLHRETRLVRERLCDLVGHEVRSFAYPFGIYDDDAAAAVGAAGYEIGFSVHHDGGPMAVSRVDVNATDTLGTLRVKMLPGYRRLWRTLEVARPLRRAIRRGAAGRRRRTTP